MTATVTWAGTLTAVSSIAHGGETRGTITLLRRELIVQPDGRAVYVPVISGNAFRGRLRRIGEELLRDVLAYEGVLPLAAAHALRGGGALAKTAGEPLSGQRLALLRALVPQVGVFGCAGGGRIIGGCLQVGKVLPHVAECAHLVPAAGSAPPAFEATQIETYVRQDDTTCHGFGDVVAPVPSALGRAGGPAAADAPPGSVSGTEMLMMYRIETFPAGTSFSTWMRLIRATPLEVSFFSDVVGRFEADGWLGGRAAVGHGNVTADLTRSVDAGAVEPVEWRPHVARHRAEALDTLRMLA